MVELCSNLEMSSTGEMLFKDVKKDLNSYEECMELITTAHILSAAMTVAEVEDLQGLSRVILSSAEHLTAVTSAAKKVCSQFCKITYCNEGRSSTNSND